MVSILDQGIKRERTWIQVGLPVKPFLPGKRNWLFSLFSTLCQVHLSSQVHTFRVICNYPIKINDHKCFTRSHYWVYFSVYPFIISTDAQINSQSTSLVNMAQSGYTSMRL